MGDPKPTRSTTVLLAKARDGDQAASQQLFVLVYDELRVVAGRYFRRERPDHTLQPTALVDELYDKLVGKAHISYRDRAHFLAVAAQKMRRILVDHARRRKAKRHGGDLKKLTISDGDGGVEDNVVDVLAIHEALGNLAEEHSRQAQVVEMRCFANMTIDEVAEELGVGHATVENDWRLARAWLHRALVLEDDT
ncbi:MAG: sigma-70 family RNA polymerase sigma factor [Gammaproteobacteria bacterium]